MMTSTVTGKRQVTVPAEIARDMGIEVGSRLEWRENSDKKSVVVTVLPGPQQMLEQAQQIARKCRGPSSSQWLKAERERDDHDRVADLRVAERPAAYKARKGKKA